MPKAREIAEERLAKGEISEDEFNSIRDNLTSDKSTNSENTGSRTSQRIIGLAVTALSPILYFYFQNRFVEAMNRCELFGKPPECMTSPDPITMAQINLVAGTLLPLIIGVLIIFWPRRK